MIQHINNNEGGGAVREKLNEVIDLTNEVPNKVERLPTAQNGNVATWLNGALIDSGQTVGGGIAVNIPNWEDVQNDPLPLDFVVQFSGRLWVSKVEGNQNSQPPTDAETTENDYWIETSESAANGAPVWTAGTYTKPLSEVFKLNTGDNIYYKYVLRAAVPFTSSDFDAELIAGDWQILAAESSILLASQAEAESNTENTKYLSSLRTFHNWINNVKTYSITELNTVSKTLVGAINWLKGLTTLTKEPTGFLNPSLVDVSYNPTTRIVTVTGTTDACWRGDLITSMVSGWMSTAHNVADGQYFLYYNGTDYVWSTTTWGFDMLMIAMVYRDGVNFCLRECHGLMQNQVHKELHETLGTYLGSGGDLSNYVLASTTASNRRPYISAATVNDEDLPTTLPALNTNAYTQLYLSGANIANSVSDQADIVPLLANNPYYNQFTGGNWIQTLFPNNAYGKVFVMAVPVTSDAECQKKRFIFIQPQTVSTTLATIQALTPSSVNLGHIAGALSEYVFIAEIIVRYTANNWQFISTAKLIGTKVLQAAVIGGGGGGGVSNTSELALSTPLLGQTNQDGYNVANELDKATESYFVSAVNEKEYITRNYDFKVTKISATSGAITLLTSSGGAYTDGTTVTANDYISISGDALNSRLFIKVERV